MKKMRTAIFVTCIGLITIAASSFTFLDTTPYNQTKFYAKQLAAIDSIAIPNKSYVDSQAVLVGWSSISLLPPFTTPIAIDAHRGGKHFDGVHDSIYVRAFVFKQGNKKIAYISADLLIIPPSVSRMFDTILVSKGYDQTNIFFTATHTHSSIGAWYNSIVGEIFAGRYDERVPRFIASTIARAILQAETKCSATKIGYGSFSANRLVVNRLVTQMAHLPDSLGTKDSLVRVIKFENAEGEKAAIVTFSAHNTVYHETLMEISADWCGAMMSKLKNSGKINFCSFSAGAVGSHGPFEFSKLQEVEAEYMANGVANVVLQNFDSIPVGYRYRLSMVHLPLYLREPNLRLTNKIVLRPWLFKKLFGDERVFVNALRLGDIFICGMPCDFSGELVSTTDSVAAECHLNQVVTSFNGGYIGYITHNKWYNLNTYETRTMGWFGYKNDEYLNEISIRLMRKVD